MVSQVSCQKFGGLVAGRSLSVVLAFASACDARTGSAFFLFGVTFWLVMAFPA